jgi:hypothetical protein
MGASVAVNPRRRVGGWPYNGGERVSLPLPRPKVCRARRSRLPMLPFMLHSCRCRRLGFGLLVASALVGCREAESISTYDTAAAGPRAQPIDVERVRGDLDHMLVAIVPQGDAAWFFKVVAHGDKAVEELRKPFEEFIGSVELGEKGATPTWKLPEGWVQKAGGEMRAATIEIPHEGKTLELAVSTLPLSGKWDAYVTRNVNRWLGQLQQGELSEKTVTGLTKSLPLKGGEATVMELVGVMERGAGMMPPGHPPVAAGGSAKPRAAEEAKTQAAAAPRAPFAGAMGAPVQVAGEFAKPAEFTYEPPAGWQPGQTSSMRKAAFVVADGDKNAEVTVMPFPANAAMSDPIAQAQRWAGQAGLTMSDDELKAAAQELKIDGTTWQQFTLLGEGGDKPIGILAAMVEQGDQVWFFKMTGDRSLVEKQGEAFGEFLASVKFAK